MGNIFIFYLAGLLVGTGWVCRATLENCGLPRMSDIVRDMRSVVSEKIGHTEIMWSVRFKGPCSRPSI